MRVLVTGSAGFIGSSLVETLLARGDEVLGIDNHNHYYDPRLKELRLSRFQENKHYSHRRIDISDQRSLRECFSEFLPERVVNLAAQAGVRYSLEAPEAYVSSNLLGFFNMIDNSRLFDVSHFVYASSSSVYGANEAVPFSPSGCADHPLNLYAATKRCNETIAHAYSHIYQMPTTGLRFFTVYGPWGRPDMALYKFTEAILEGRPIQLFNQGDHYRDFTFIDDVVEGIKRVIDKPATSNPEWDGFSPDCATSLAPWRVYNIGNGRPVSLLQYVELLEKYLGKAAVIEYLPLQLGDVYSTSAEISGFQSEFKFRPRVNVEEGIEAFVIWYKNYHGID